MASGIYEIVNIVNGHEYVGQTGDFDERAGTHWTSLRGGYHHNKHLQSAWDKYGEESFIYDVLEVVEIPDGLTATELRDYLVPYEQLWMDKLDPYYNMAPAAGSNRGIRHTDEARANMSAAFMGRNKGVPQSPETIEKRRQSMIGHEVTPETRQKIGDAHRGMSSPLKGVPRDPEVIAKMSESQMGHEVTESARAKISASLRQYHQDVRDGKIMPKPRKRRKPRSTEAKAKTGDALRGRKRPQHVIDALWAGRDRYIAEQRAIKDAAEQSSLEGMNGDSHPDEAAGTP